MVLAVVLIFTSHRATALPGLPPQHTIHEDDMLPVTPGDEPLTHARRVAVQFDAVLEELDIKVPSGTEPDLEVEDDSKLAKRQQGSGKAAARVAPKLVKTKRGMVSTLRPLLSALWRVVWWDVVRLFLGLLLDNIARIVQVRPHACPGCAIVGPYDCCAGGYLRGVAHLSVT